MFSFDVRTLSVYRASLIAPRHDRTTLYIRCLKRDRTRNERSPEKVAFPGAGRRGHGGSGESH